MEPVVMLKALELYSGIGGFHFAAQNLKCVEIVSAVDINPFANETYSHNFPNVKVMQRNIESLKAEEIDELGIDLMWMSPPCQPFTRLGKQLGSADKRTESFLRVIQQIPMLKKRPSYILLENVKGFESSETRNDLIEMLTQSGYEYQEFLLSPSQVGVPNSRLRYYIVAKLKPLTFRFQTTNEVMTDFPTPRSSRATRNLKEFLETEVNEEHLLPDKVLMKFVNLLDIVDEDSTHSCCFTKGYKHMVEGTGSVLTGNKHCNVEETCRIASSLENDEEKLRLLKSLQLRYFSSREVANVMGFPSHFEFPKTISLKQQYRLLGNSLNVFLLQQILELCL